MKIFVLIFVFLTEIKTDFCEDLLKNESIVNVFANQIVVEKKCEAAKEKFVFIIHLKDDPEQILLKYEQVSFDKLMENQYMICHEMSYFMAEDEENFIDCQKIIGETSSVLSALRQKSFEERLIETLKKFSVSTLRTPEQIFDLIKQKLVAENTKLVDKNPQYQINETKITPLRQEGETSSKWIVAENSQTQSQEYITNSLFIKKLVFADFQLTPIIVIIKDHSKNFLNLQIELSGKELNLLVPRVYIQQDFVVDEKQTQSKEIDQEYLIKVSQFFKEIFLKEKKLDTSFLNQKILALSPYLLPYVEMDIISFPIALILIDNLLQNSDILKDILENIEKDEQLKQSKIILMNNFKFSKNTQTQQDSIDDNTKDPIPKEWFFINNDKISFIGNLFTDLKVLEQGQILPEQERIKRFLQTYEKYIINNLNYHEFTFGIESLQQKMIIKVYGYENSFFNSVQIKIETAFFTAEHVVSLNSFQKFYLEVRKHLVNAIHHLHEVVHEIQQNQEGREFILSLKNINYIISQYLESGKFCLDEKNNLWRIMDVSVLKNKQKFCENNFQNEKFLNETDEKKIEEQVKKRFCGNDLNDEVVKITQSDPDQMINVMFYNQFGKSSLNSNMKFQNKHRFNFNKILDKSLRVGFCKLFNNEHNRQKLELNSLKDFFGFR